MRKSKASQISWGRKTKDAEGQQNLKRRVLLDVAAHEFTTKGYSGTSLGGLADLVKVSKPALYYYVKNKEDILLQCIEISLELIMDLFEQVNRTELNGLDRLRGYFHKYGEICVEDYGYALILEGHKHLSPANKQKMQKIMRRGQEAVEQLVEVGIKDGSIAPCEPKYVAYLLLSTFNQMAFWFNPSGAYSRAKIVNELLNIAFSGLIPRK